MTITGDNYGTLHYSFYKHGEKVKNTEVVKSVTRAARIAGFAVGAIIGATIIEDVVTGGSGAIDDIPSIIGAAGVAAAIFGY